VRCTSIARLNRKVPANSVTDPVARVPTAVANFKVPAPCFVKLLAPVKARESGCCWRHVKDLALDSESGPSVVAPKLMPALERLHCRLWQLKALGYY